MFMSQSVVNVHIAHNLSMLLHKVIYIYNMHVVLFSSLLLVIRVYACECILATSLSLFILTSFSQVYHEAYTGYFRSTGY